MAAASRNGEDIVFISTSFVHVLLTVLLAQLVSGAASLNLPVVAFALASKAFALAVGERERVLTKARRASLPLALLSLLLLLPLPPLDIVLGFAILLLYLTYPALIRARERPPLDILYHGSRYALLFLFGHAGQPFTDLTMMGVLLLFLFGVSGELLAGLGASRPVSRSTASLLGPRPTRLLVATLIFTATLLGGLLFSHLFDLPLQVGVSLPIPLILSLPLALYISRPVVRGVASPGGVVRRRELVLSTLMVVAILLVPPLTRVDINLNTPGEDHSVIVVMKTLVAGRWSWDVPWIIFDFRDEGNYYYLLLHKGGLLELSRVSDGRRELFLAAAQTHLSPFDWHEYRIDLAGGQIKVLIDGAEYLRFEGRVPGGLVKVSNTSPRGAFWFAWIAEAKSLPLIG